MLAHRAARRRPLQDGGRVVLGHRRVHALVIADLRAAAVSAACARVRACVRRGTLCWISSNTAFGIVCRCALLLKEFSANMSSVRAPTENVRATTNRATRAEERGSTRDNMGCCK